ncbi:hypothetical protein NDU88_002680 [Pleurodeles waltl]|uniref:Uncharacterized protein n=1 Tax=Pleurodeles waltl TaxID=8319 RepID=A0AAV7V0E3_PLEWA|nr:hypothetical protein NDU88_002680 [Pleurodeles waltl]
MEQRNRLVTEDVRGLSGLSQGRKGSSPGGPGPAPLSSAAEEETTVVESHSHMEAGSCLEFCPKRGLRAVFPPTRAVHVPHVWRHSFRDLARSSPQSPAVGIYFSPILSLPGTFPAVGGGNLWGCDPREKRDPPICEEYHIFRKRSTGALVLTRWI